jgi:hypothetical protein
MTRVTRRTFVSGAGATAATAAAAAVGGAEPAAADRPTATGPPVARQEGNDTAQGEGDGEGGAEDDQEEFTLSLGLVLVMVMVGLGLLSPIILAVLLSLSDRGRPEEDEQP